MQQKKTLKKPHLVSKMQVNEVTEDRSLPSGGRVRASQSTGNMAVCFEWSPMPSGSVRLPPQTAFYPFRTHSWYSGRLVEIHRRK